MPKKYLQAMALAALSMVLNSACTDTTVKADNNGSTAGKLSFTRHPEPPAKDMSSPFKALGCPKSHDNEIKPCGPLAQFGCSSISLFDSSSAGVLAAFEPFYPIAACMIYLPYGQPRLKENEYVSAGGGILPQYARYIIAKDGKFTLLKNKTDFQHHFLPIDSGFEALAMPFKVTFYPSVD